MLPVVILAGGMATRLYPVTRTIPKALIPIADRPFIDHQLTLLKENGVEEVILCIGNMGQQIEDFVGDGSRWGLEIRYSYDGDILLGTGGAVKKATRLLPDAFMILYGDSYLDLDYSQVVLTYFKMDLPVMMTIYRNRNSHEKSNILVKNGRIALYSKTEHDPAMEYIDYGLMVIRKKNFDSYPSEKPFDLSLVLSKAVTAGLVGAYEVENRFYEVGSARGIRETEDYIRQRRLSSYQ